MNKKIEEDEAMIPGLLKQFLKKLAGSTADTGNPVGSRKSNSQPGFKSFRLKLATTVLLSIFGCATAFPALAALDITSATWDGKKLVVHGVDGKGGIVDVYYGYDDTLSMSLGSASVRGNGAWKLHINTNPNNPLVPVPCAVSATLGNETISDFMVEGAPADCAPEPPVGNRPPVCTIDTPAGDVTIATGGSVDYTGTVVDPDVGDTVTIAWDFAGGTPLSSSMEDPGLVAYNTAGIFTTTLNATDNNGASCVQQSRTITVADQPVNTPPTANDDFYNATSGEALNIAAPGVLSNDTDDGLLSPLVVSGVVSDVANGTLNLLSDGSFDYTSNAGFEGDDSFIYQVSDGELTAQATATITVTAVPVVDTQCSDGIDNDGDTLIDYPDDPGCVNVADDDETDVAPPVFADQTDFKIMMNYELGMHCTGFEFAYCCVLPAYNSILAQVVKPDATGQGHPELMAGDPNEGLDALGRQTVVRDRAQDGNGFKKYVLKYQHDAQPRNNGLGKAQTSTLISAEEGNSLLSWNTTFDSAMLDADGKFVLSGGANPEYNGAQGVVLGNGIPGEPADNYQNAVWNHLYFYNGLEGEFACSAPAASVGNRCSVDADCDTGPGNGVCNVNSIDANKTRLGVNGHVVYPTDCGPALHPMGPVTTDPNDPTKTIANDCAGLSNGNVLTFSGEHGTVVYTQMKVLENLPIMLTSPDIWEALGLPLTPFEDSVDFFGDPGLLNEDSVRPFVAMSAQMYDYNPAAPGGAGAATLDGNGDPIIGFGTAPIDIPNCERCHSNPPNGTKIPNSVAESAFPGEMLTVVNSPNLADSQQWLDVQAEYSFWNAYYNIDTAAGDSDWYSRLKSAAISMLTGHDDQHGTSFTANYPGCIDSNNPSSDCGAMPQSTRLGHESVICQRCHADNVIAAVKSAECGAGSELGSEQCATGTLIKPITEAIHNNHRGVNMLDANGVPGIVTFADSLGRDGGCQGCHPAHRSDGDMNGYPITLAGANKYAGGDNRGANGGCFVGRDVHSNPGKDSDGVETPAHMNAVGQYLVDNVANDGNGIWCTNCHNQLGQEIWKTENMTSLVHNQGTSNPRAGATLRDVALAVGLDDVGALAEDKAIAWLDPTDDNPLGDLTYAIWDTDPGLCNYVAGYFGVIPVDSAHDGNVATVEVNVTSAANCSTGGGSGLIDCGAAYPGAPAFHICGSLDGDGDFSVNAMDFCTTPDCVDAAQATLAATVPTGDSVAVPVPMSAATDGRDHWLSPGEPHCADCHAAPFVEQSGNINAYPPFNYPRKASLMRYSKGHQNISCQGCHESIHGLYPVTPNIDTTSYAQAAALNHDGSHGPLKCGTCHAVDGQGIPTFMDTSGNNVYGITDYDSAVAWAHEYTDEQSALDTTCQNCHGVQGTNWSDVNIGNGTYMEHASRSNPRGSRQMMDKAEMEVNGGSVFTDTGTGVAGTDGDGGLCLACHGADGNNVSCTNGKWLDHLTEGRVSTLVFENVSVNQTGGTCW